MGMFEELQKFDYIKYGFLIIFIILALEDWYFERYIFPFYIYLTLFLMLVAFNTFGFYFYLISFFFGSGNKLDDIASFLPINMTTVYLIVGLFMLGLFISRRKTANKWNINNYFMISWLIIIIMSILTFSIELERNWVIIGMFEGIIIYFIMFYFIKDKKSLKKSTWFIMLTLALFGLRAFRSIILGGGFWRAGLFGYDNNYFSLVLIPGVALSYFLMVSVKNRTHKLLLTLTFIAFITSIFWLGSRGGLITLIIVGAFIIIKSTFSLKTFKYAILIPIIGLIVFNTIPSYLIDRYETIEDAPLAFEEKGEGEASAGGAYSQRIQLVYAGLKMFQDHLLFGIGINRFNEEIPNYGDFGKGKNSHNLYIQLLAETGILGGTIFLAIVFFSLYNSYSASVIFKRMKETEYYYLCLAVLGALIGFYIAAFFLNPQQRSIMWMFVGLATSCKIVAAKEYKEYQNKEKTLAT